MRVQVKRGSAAKLGVVNLSVGGQYSPHWEGLVAALNAAGLVVVAAAGNRDLDACSQSPSHVASVLTVGATNFDDTKAGSATLRLPWERGTRLTSGSCARGCTQTGARA